MDYQELVTYFVSSIGIVGAIMTAVKELPFVKKEWYTYIAGGLTTIAVVIATVAIGWNWGVFLGGLLIVFASEYGVDKKIFRPLLEKLLKK